MRGESEVAVIASPQIIKGDSGSGGRPLLRGARTAGWSLVCLLILATGALGVYIHTGHGAVTPVLTGSMRPGISPGDAVVTQRVPVSSLRVGDIIVFKPPGATLARVHRIASLGPAKTGIAITTKGDANNAGDPWGRIVLRGTSYRVQFTIPKVGYLVDGGMRWLITGFVLMFGLLIGRMTWKYVRA
jgi:signal peptidase